MFKPGNIQVGCFNWRSGYHYRLSRRQVIF